MPTHKQGDVPAATTTPGVSSTGRHPSPWGLHSRPSSAAPGSRRTSTACRLLTRALEPHGASVQPSARLVQLPCTQVRPTQWREPCACGWDRHGGGHWEALVAWCPSPKPPPRRSVLGSGRQLSHPPPPAVPSEAQPWPGVGGGAELPQALSTRPTPEASSCPSTSRGDPARGAGGVSRTLFTRRALPPSQLSPRKGPQDPHGRFLASITGLAQPRSPQQAHSQAWGRDGRSRGPARSTLPSTRPRPGCGSAHPGQEPGKPGLQLRGAGGGHSLRAPHSPGLTHARCSPTRCLAPHEHGPPAATP